MEKTKTKSTLPFSSWDIARKQVTAINMKETILEYLIDEE
jgi:hypothetical protein